MDSLANDGLCSLREAITAANTDSAEGGCPAGSGDDLVLLGSGPYSLEIVGPLEDDNLSNDLDIRSNITIEGTLAGEHSVVDGNGLDRVFDIENSRVILRNLTITGGRPLHADVGGGIRSFRGDVSLENCRVAGNQAGDSTGNGFAGGGIFSQDGVLDLVDSEVANNRAGDGTTDGSHGGDGGGIFSDGTLTVAGSTITGNRAGHGRPGTNFGGSGGRGGGIFGVGPFVIRDSTVSHNDAGDGGDAPVAGAGGLGGGILAAARFQQPDSFVAERVTISFNSAGRGGSGTTFARGGGDGGGIIVFSGGSLRNVTIHGNSAGASGVGPVVLPGGRGGGFAAYLTDAMANATTQLNNVTVADNTAEHAGGIAAIGEFSLPRIEVGNSIVAQNVGGNCLASAGLIVSVGYNVESGTDCGFFGPGDQQNASSGLLPLGAYGGPTQTRALGPQSAALDAGSPALPGSGNGACEAVDQRGVPRPRGPVCDAGAFEGTLSVVDVPGPGAAGLAVLSILLAGCGLLRLALPRG
jgi:CSLREA domain-containing protein